MKDLDSIPPAGVPPEDLDETEIGNGEIEGDQRTPVLTEGIKAALLDSWAEEEKRVDN